MNESPIYDRVQSELEGRKKECRFRTVAEPGNRRSIDLATNSYLALHACEEVAAEAKYLADNCFSGNLASRLIETQTSLYPMLESELCEWEKTGSALVFNSGYTANLGIIEALCTRDTEVFSDRLNHASIVDGIRLSGASLARYGHCDMRDLKRRLESSSRKERLIITDTVFSMDGDLAPLPDICDLAKQYKCMVMADEAHATGVFGNRLCGCVEKFGLEKCVDIKMGTLSKSFAGLGGFFAGSRLVRDFLVNKARSLIYSTALPQSVLAHDLASLRHIRAHPELGKSVLENSAKLRDAIRSLGFDTLKSESQIIPLVTGDEGQALGLSVFLSKQGINAPAIRPPTVPKGTSRIRFSVHAGLTYKDISHIIESLALWKKSNA
jgi:8-amino-7-oxononanoate synthase